MVNCPYCGTSNRASAAYCNNCGGALGAVPGSTAPRIPHIPIMTGAPGAHATGRLAPSSTLARCYLIDKVVGQGGMAAVYKAIDTRNKQPVAIKEMSQDGLTPAEVQESLDAFRFEADTLMRLSHPNLPKVFGRFSEGARHYLVMEYIDGQTLEQRLTANNTKALPEREVMAWADQICSVLNYLHTQRPPIIFRDLKPGNIMVTTDGKIKLIDFGIARVFTPGRIRDTQALGTPGFAPPEQYGKAQTDARADVYALGCTLYQLLSGYDPATTPFALPPLASRQPSISPHIQFAVERATKLDRDQRYATIEEMRKALLYPAGIYFRSGEFARTLPELVVLCQRYPQEAAEHLYVGRIVGWLHAWGEQKAARAAAEVVAKYKDHAAGLAAFLANVQPTKASAKSTAKPKAGGRTTAQPRTTNGPQPQPQTRGGGTATATTAAASAAATATSALVVVQPRRVDFGTLVAGQRGTVTITISGQNGASVQGKITSFDPWLMVDTTSFSGGSTLVQLTAETSKMPRPGAKQTSLHIRSGNQHVYVPVSVVVTPGKGSTGRPSPAITRVNPVVKPGSKYGAGSPAQPTSHRWSVGIISGLVLSFAASAAVLVGVPTLLSAWQPDLMHYWPVATLVLLLTALAAMGGALAGVGGRGWAGRPQITLGGALAGLAITLASGGSFLLSFWPSIPPDAWHIDRSLALAAVLVSIGATLGADTVIGRALLSIWTFLARRMPMVVTLLGMGLGAWAGVAIASDVLRGALVPVGFLAGLILGGIVAGWVNRLFRRTGVTRAYP